MDVDLVFVPRAPPALVKHTSTDRNPLRRGRGRAAAALPFPLPPACISTPVDDRHDDRVEVEPFGVRRYSLTHRPLLVRAL